MLGLDFGTTTTLLASSSRGISAIEPLGSIDAWLPSVAAIVDGNIVVCEAALLNPTTAFIRSIKREITEQPTGKLLLGSSRSFLNVDDKLSERTIFLNDQRSNPVTVLVRDVVTKILEHVAGRAKEEFLPIDRPGEVRMGCPAEWTGPQRRFLLECARSVGMGVTGVHLLDEPVAAAFAWLEARRSDVDFPEEDLELGKVVIFDMGGGTLDIAVTNITRDGITRGIDMAVQSAIGDHQAGDHLDQALQEVLISKYEKEAMPGIHDLKANQEFKAVVLSQARDAKEYLSSQTEVKIAMTFAGTPAPIVSLRREELEIELTPQLDLAIEQLDIALRLALLTEVPDGEGKGFSGFSSIFDRNLDPREKVKHVVLVGGMSQIPAIQERLLDHFRIVNPRFWLGTGPLRDSVSNDASRLVALGLATEEIATNINMHRPNFGFHLFWTNPQGDTQSVQLFESFGVLFRHQHETGWNDSTQYVIQINESFVLRNDLPRSGFGYIAPVDLDGNEISTWGYDGTPDDEMFSDESDVEIIPGLVFQFGHSFDGRFVLKPTGEIYYKDTASHEVRGRIPGWHLIKYGGSFVLDFKASRRYSWIPPENRNPWNGRPLQPQ